MASNSHVGTYSYTGSPVPHAPASVAGQAFTYDAKANMTQGLHVKVMRYDGENRPLSVTHNGNTSAYLYSADGTRLMKREIIPQQGDKVTLYVGGIEVRNPGPYETVLAYPHGNIRLSFANENGFPEENVSYLFRDQLNSVRVLADAFQVVEEKSSYTPFGEENESILTVNAVPEKVGWIGERFDAGAGLQFLNARYYDPESGLFLQPDWFEVTEAGVGTNRYSYSFNDPVNLSDPGGNRVGDLSVGCRTCDFYDEAEGATGGPSIGDYRRNPEAEAAIEKAYEVIGDVSGINGAADAITAAASGDLGGVFYGVVEVGAGKLKAVKNVAETTIRQLRKQRKQEAHHIIQDAAVRDIPGYNSNSAPGIQLPGPSAKPETPHGKTRRVQKQAAGGTYGAERRVGYKALRAAGLSPENARVAIQQADRYFESLGVTKLTPTRRPRDRRTIK